jgi:ATP-dependent protease Clp ATPase subunit
VFWKRSVPDKTPRCSFCRKAEEVVGELISSPSNDFIYICSECVAVCNGILDDRRSDKEHVSSAGGADGNLTVPDDDVPLVVRDKTVSVRYTIGRAAPPRSS